LRIERDARFEIHLHLRPLLTEILQRGGQPLNTAVTLDGDTQLGLLRFIALLQRSVDLRQYLRRQLQQDLSLRRKAQRLAFTNE